MREPKGMNAVLDNGKAGWALKKTGLEGTRPVSPFQWLPECASIRTLRGQAEPEVWFRIVYITRDSQQGGPAAVCCEQPVEITPGPNREGGTNTARIAVVNLKESFR